MNKLIKNTYITIDDGIDFRRISEIMTSKNIKMNHATARNVLMSGLIKLINHISENVESKLNETQLDNLLKNADFHDALSDILFEATQEEKEEKASKQ